jgi:hypothetical protein
MYSETIFYYFVFINILIKNSQFQNYLSETCKDKINYYHDLKTQFRSRYETKHKLLVRFT